MLLQERYDIRGYTQFDIIYIILQKNRSNQLNDFLSTLNQKKLTKSTTTNIPIVKCDLYHLEWLVDLQQQVVDQPLWSQQQHAALLPKVLEVFIITQQQFIKCLSVCLKLISTFFFIIYWNLRKLEMEHVKSNFLTKK